VIGRLLILAMLPGKVVLVLGWIEMLDRLLAWGSMIPCCTPKMHSGMSNTTQSVHLRNGFAREGLGSTNVLSKPKDIVTVFVDDLQEVIALPLELSICSKRR
jgi:hypothetical protein